MLNGCRQFFRAGMALRSSRLVYGGFLRFASKGFRTHFSTGASGGSLLKPLPALTHSPTSYLHTTGVKGSCMPTQLPPKCGPTGCVIAKPNIWKDCRIRKRPKWKGCNKICMPCCCPAIAPPDCEQIEIRQNTCKRLEYRIPSFSECRKYPLGKRIKKECCTSSMPCPEAGLSNLIEPLISTKVRQETILGRRTGGRMQARNFSTSAIAMKRQDSGNCQKNKSKACLKPSGVISKNSKAASRKNCEKQCMPCCAPARDPPDCHYPAAKIQCKRSKPPRPAFSECIKEKQKKVSACECRPSPAQCLKKTESSQNSC